MYEGKTSLVKLSSISELITSDMIDKNKIKDSDEIISLLEDSIEKLNDQ